MSSHPAMKPLDPDVARAAILDSVTPLAEIVTVEVSAALQRVLAEDLVADIDVPGFANSAMDGYAVSSRNLPRDALLPVSQHIRAGDRPQPLAPGTAARIFTGAPLPDGADCIIMQENCERDGDTVRLLQPVAPGEFVRPRGHDVSAGAVVLPAGQRMRPQDVAMVAALGVDRVRVRRRPRVAIFSTGNELALPGQALQPGQRYTANNHLLKALAAQSGAEITDAGIVPDDLQQTRDTMQMLARDHDLLLSSGGASVGDEDHVRRALSQAGEVTLWRIAMRPGKPLLFGHLGAAAFMGLPGNPVSSFVTFLLLVRPLLLALQGAPAPTPLKLPVRAGFDWPRPGTRREFVRVQTFHDADGELTVALYPDQSSDVLSSTVWADGLVEIPPGAVFTRGDRVYYLPYSGLLD